MSTTPFSSAAIAGSCREHAAAFAEAFGRCFGRDGSFAVAEPAAWGTAEPPAGPGLAVRIATADGGMAALVPAGLLPAWYAAPDEAQKEKLKSLAAEWAAILLPGDAAVDVTDAEAVPDLAKAAADFASDSWAEVIPLSAGDGSGAIQLITPVSRLALLAAAVEPERGTSPGGRSGRPEDAPARRAGDARPQKLARLKNVPVQVVVRLAEKRIEMGQVVSIAPGALITFGKNCEELLDLYVNNRLYCRGEAVKIGEHFGLRINEVGAVKVREERVF